MAVATVVHVMRMDRAGRGRVIGEAIRADRRQNSAGRDWTGNLGIGIVIVHVRDGAFKWGKKNRDTGEDSGEAPYPPSSSSFSAQHGWYHGTPGVGLKSAEETCSPSGGQSCRTDANAQRVECLQPGVTRPQLLVAWQDPSGYAALL